MKILVIGQIPPPHGGQALMIELMLSYRYKKFELVFLPVTFSRNMSALGSLSFAKVLMPLIIFIKATYLRFAKNIDALYYPPSGPKKISVWKDMVVLASLRWMFKFTVFHFHAAGTCEAYARLPRPGKFIFKYAFFSPDISIQTSALNPPDGAFINSKKVLIVPNGIPDFVESGRDYAGEKVGRFRYLYVGVLTRTKGLFDLLLASAILKEKRCDFEVRLVGEFQFAEEEIEAREFILQHGLKDNVVFCGVLAGKEKWLEYASADVFCFPTYFECESFGLVVVEAMQWSLPVIITRWRGVQGLITDQREGFLVDPTDAYSLAEQMNKLRSNDTLREQMGKLGRQRYECMYSAPAFKDGIEAALSQLAQD